MARFWCSFWWVIVPLLAGCLYERNPQFSPSESTGSASGSSSLDEGETPTTGFVDTGEGASAEGASGDTSPDEPPETPPFVPEAGCETRECTVIRIGPQELSCGPEHDEPCDYWGEDALLEAQPNLPSSDVRIILHAGGPRTNFNGGLVVPHRTTITTASEDDEKSLRVRSRGGPVFVLPANRVRIANLTVMGGPDCETLLSFESGAGASSEHLLENLTIANVAQEYDGYNGVDGVFDVFPERSVLRNSHIWGYFRTLGAVSFAHESTLDHNSIMLYQAGASPLLEGAA